MGALEGVLVGVLVGATVTGAIVVLGGNGVALVVVVVGLLYRRRGLLRLLGNGADVTGFGGIVGMGFWISRYRKYT